MPIKNYTTKVPANKSIAQIQKMLVDNGASKILLDYEQGTGRIESFNFMLPFGEKQIPFRLPINWRSFQLVLREQGIKRSEEDEYCYRVAWRNIRDWVDVQMALYQTGLVDIVQIFLPYAVMSENETLFEKVVNGTFLLESPKEE